MEADWIDLRRAVETVLASVKPVAAESCPVDSSLGRVLAEDVVAPIDLPLWTNSGMDGFAVRRQDIEGASPGAPITLPVRQDIPAGAFPTGPLESGTAARVMTGAPIPDGTDSVIRIEDTDGGSGIGTAAGMVQIFDGRDANRNIRKRGEDIARGSAPLHSGMVVDAGVIGLAASLGKAELTVFRRPRVGLMTSGDELVEVTGFSEVLAGRKIVSSNTYTLAAQIQEAGCEVEHLGIARDSPSSVRETLSRAAGCDALVTSAGVSVGEHDLVRSIILEMGATVHFWRVRIRPGSPFAFGTLHELGGIPWFGLPGNPVSSMVTFELFARPALLKMAGGSRVFRRTVKAEMRDDHASPAGLTHVLRVWLERLPDGSLSARLTGPQGSGILRSVAGANGLLIVPEGEEGARSGRKYDVIALPSFLQGDGPGY